MEAVGTEAPRFAFAGESDIAGARAIREKPRIVACEAEADSVLSGFAAKSNGLVLLSKTPEPVPAEQGLFPERPQRADADRRESTARGSEVGPEVLLTKKGEGEEEAGTPPMLSPGYTVLFPI